MYLELEPCGVCLFDLRFLFFPVLAEEPNVNFVEVGRRLLDGWRSLRDEEKAHYHERSDALAKGFKDKFMYVSNVTPVSNSTDVFVIVEKMN